MVTASHRAQTARLSLIIALIVLAAGASAQTISSSRPRLWLTSERLARLKDYAARNTQRWQDCKYRADQAVNGTTTDPLYLAPLALCYQVTGNTAYADRAIQLLLVTCTPENTLSQWEYHAYRDVLPAVSAALDWCYNRMTTAQRQQVADWLMDRSDFIWPETNPDRTPPNGWGVDKPANNYFYGFLMSWVAAIAAYGDDPTTSGTISSPNRPVYHLNLALNKYRNMVRPFTDEWGLGGIFFESNSYDSTERLSTILEAHRTGTGQDLVNETGFRFMHDSILWRVHSTLPNLGYYYPIGDQSRDPAATISDYDRRRMYQAMAMVNDDTLKRYAKSWLDSIVLTRSRWPITCAWEFLYVNEDAPSASYTNLPLSYFAPGPGMLFRRSDWGQSATHWGIWAGPLVEGHQNKDVNGFQIYKDGWLLAHQGILASSGLAAQHTINHNNYTFGGNGQRWQEFQTSQWPEHAGRTLKVEDNPAYAYFAGQAWMSYTNRSTNVSYCRDYVRKFAYLDPDKFVVYDRIELPSAATPKELWLHALRPFTINGRDWAFDNTVHRLHGSTLLPATGVTLSATAVTDSASGDVSNRLSIVTNGGRAKDYILNVFQITPATTTNVTAPVAVTSDQGNMEGARLPGWVVLFGRTESVQTPVNYATDGAQPSEHLLFDLAPNTNYPVAIRSSSTGQVTNTTVTSTAQGTLLFTVAAGAHTIGIGSGAANSSPPTLSSLSPSSATAGGAAFTLTVDGSGFVSGATVKWNGQARTTTFVSSTRVSASIPAADIATAGTAQVTATNPGTGDSNALTFTINSAPTYTLSASPSSVRSGENIAVTWSAPAGTSAQDWIGLFKVGSSNTSYVWWRYTGGLTSGVFNAVAPNEAGDWEFRYFLNNGYTLAARSNTVAVSGGSYSVTVAPTSASPGQNVTVSWTAPAGASSTDWIGLFKAADPNRNYLWYRYTQGAASGSITIPAPNEPGQYQFRYLLNNGYDDAARTGNLTVNVSYTVSASPTSVSGGASVTVSWTAPSGASPTDWIGLYKVGTASGAYISWFYTGGSASGSLAFTMPGQGGDYEFRYFLNNGFTQAAKSGTVTVTGYGLFASPSTAAKGGQVTVTWSVPAGAAAKDWIGLYRVEDPNGSYFRNWIYTNGAVNGSRAFTMPSTAGQYEFRYFVNNSFTLSYRSNPVTVN